MGKKKGRKRRGGQQQNGGGGHGQHGGGRGASPPSQQPSEASSSSRASGVGPSQAPDTEADVSSELVELPLRPDTGSLGTKCKLKANHFHTELADKELFQYNVTITPDVTSRVLNHAVIRRLVDQHRATTLGNKLPAYDGMKLLYSAERLPFETKEFDEITTYNVTREFKVVIETPKRLEGDRGHVRQEFLQALNIVLRESPTQNYCSVGRLFYKPRTPSSLGSGLQRLDGFYQSIRPTQTGLKLNLDFSSTAFISPLNVVDFVRELIPRYTGNIQLTPDEYAKIDRELRGVKVEIVRRGMHRKYRINSLTALLTGELTFKLNGQGTETTVVDYFKNTYNITLDHTLLPCLDVGTADRPNYLPMELCVIVDGQRYTKNLSTDQTTEFIRGTCLPPTEREKCILKTVRGNAYGSDAYANEFGIRISEEMIRVDARILPPPQLKYNDTGAWQMRNKRKYNDAGRGKDCVPVGGAWQMRNKRMLKGGEVKYWICIDFANLRSGEARTFCHKLIRKCNEAGMKVNEQPVFVVPARQESVDRVLRDSYSRANKNLDLLIAILPDNGRPLYGHVKRICETDLGIVSQCCLKKHVSNPRQGYLGNLALKMNVKTGGTNTVLCEAFHKGVRGIHQIPTIIFGANVTHPRPGEGSGQSIAAVVASQNWPWMSYYAARVSAQTQRQEIIEELCSMVTELLKSFMDSNCGVQPMKIIFYRNGVGEGQFSNVVKREVSAIEKAFELLKLRKPSITFVVVQKRHHTRFFLENNDRKENHNGMRHVDKIKSENILAGTVVESGICHPTQFDFYLCSHAAIQGTSRPVHYHVLRDDNQFSADGLQTLTNNLCYTYARCTRSVSIVTPVYYAHLAAFRARFYVVDGVFAPLHENVKNSMFFC